MLSEIKNLVLDMDGVLWHGETPVPGLVQFFETLDQVGIGYVLATNNATKTVNQYTDKLKRFGVDIAPERILTSAEITGDHLQSHYPLGSAVYVIGDKGLFQAMETRGFEIITPDEVYKGARPSLVVLGFTADAVYNQLAMAALLVENGAAFVGTNPDPSLPTELGPLPGAGALLAVISTSTGVQPQIIGKPQPIMFEHALKRLNSQKSNTAMVGDRLSTDIAGAKAAGLWAILVLSGIAETENIQQAEYEPDFVFTDITELGVELQRAAQD
ncbi:MAG: HAD-IIA family hydrolase [Candidatus Promineifilaceae bacterium]